MAVREMQRIAVLGTLDTKREEVSFIRGLIEARGHLVTVVGVGPLGSPLVFPDISNEQVAKGYGMLIRALKEDLRPALLMKEHGILALGADLKAAYYLADLVEGTARIAFIESSIKIP